MPESNIESLARSWAEIDSQALIQNLTSLPVPPKNVVAVVKADAYGHGLSFIAPILTARGVCHWGVATVAEGKQLRRILTAVDHFARHDEDEHQIFLMPAFTPAQAKDVVGDRLIPFCTDIEQARAISNAARDARAIAPIHIEVNTGIGRAGVAPDDLADFIRAVRSLPNIVVTGVCTHFTNADDPEGPDDALGQHALFEKALSTLDPKWLAGVNVHCANSPAVLRAPRALHQLIRPGLLLYGIAPCAQVLDGFKYRPVMALKARILLSRRLPAGTDISYSRTFTLDHEATVLTIGIGYGDGFPRRLSNMGSILLPDGKRAPIRGRICMDQLCVEAPEGGSYKPGDIVTLIGTVKREAISALDIAEAIDTTPHEITTCLTGRIPRVVV